MKLKNKKTGEIVDHIWWDSELKQLWVYGKHVKFYNSLAELNEEWEDVPEEPKEYWFISTTGEAHRFEGEDKTYTPSRKQLGNYFETREEAEKTVERLRAWKRLKDKGFRLDAVVDNFFCLDIYMSGEAYEAIKNDLKIVFGGEE